MLESTIISNDYPVSVPDVSQLITEDDTPVDNFASEKQQRLLVNSLYSSQISTLPKDASQLLYCLRSGTTQLRVLGVDPDTFG